MLLDRYQNNCVILRAHVNAITFQQPLIQETAKDLRQLLRTVGEHRLSLENMGQPVNEQDHFLAYLITKKPENSRNFQHLEQNLRPTTTSRNFAATTST